MPASCALATRHTLRHCAARGAVVAASPGAARFAPPLADGGVGPPPASEEPYLRAVAQNAYSAIADYLAAIRDVLMQRVLPVIEGQTFILGQPTMSMSRALLDLMM